MELRSEVGGVRPKHEGPPTGNVGFRFVSFRAVRDVSCVRRRARDRSIARALILGGLISVVIDPWPRQTLEIFLLRHHGVVFT